MVGSTPFELITKTRNYEPSERETYFGSLSQAFLYLKAASKGMQYSRGVIGPPRLKPLLVLPDLLMRLPAREDAELGGLRQVPRHVDEHVEEVLLEGDLPDEPVVPVPQALHLDLK